MGAHVAPVAMSKDVATKVLDAMMDGYVQNPHGFRDVATRTKHGLGRDYKPTFMERLSQVVYSDEEDKIPVREQSPRGRRKRAARARANARMKDFQERLNAYRQQPGVHKLAKKLPYPTWPEIVQ